MTVYNLLSGRVRAERARDGVLVERWTGSAGRPGRRLPDAFNAHTLVRFGHMQALHVQFLPLALDAVHDCSPARRARAALLGGMFALQSLTSNYLLVMTATALMAAALGAAGLAARRARRLGQTRPPRRRAAAAVPPALLPRRT